MDKIIYCGLLSERIGGELWQDYKTGFLAEKETCGWGHH